MGFSFSEAKKLNTNDSSDGTSEEPQICSDNQGNVYACWRDDRRFEREYAIYFRRGEVKGDGDIDWKEEQEIGLLGGNGLMPKIVCDNSNHVYVVWIDLADDDISYNIYFNHSSDRGINWDYLYGRSINGETQEIYRTSVSLACDNNGHVYVAWDDMRSGNEFKTYFDYSSNHGTTWHQDQLLGTFGDPEGFNPRVSCDEDGHVYVIWYGEVWPSGSSIYFNRSSDYGQTWNVFDTRISEFAAKIGPPRIDNNGFGKVYVAWADRRSGNQQVYVNYSHDNGVTWQPEEIKISDPEDNIWADNVALKCRRGFGMKNVYVAWRDARAGDRNGTYFDYSKDSGVTWHQDIQLNTDIGNGGTELDMGTDNNGYVYVAWISARDGTYPTIWMNYSNNDGENWHLGDLNVNDSNNSCHFPKVTATRWQGEPYAGFIWQEKMSLSDVYANGLKFNNSGIAVVPGPGPENKPYVRVFDENGLQMGEDFLAYNLSGYGAEVAGGDLLEGLDEAILTGPGPGSGYGPNVRGFEIDGDPAPGLNFIAYGVRQYGVNVGIGQIDRTDAAGEILTGPGPGEMFGPHVRVWKYDGEKVTALGSGFFAYGVRKYGVRISSADIDGDGVDEILTGPGPGPMFGAHVKCWKYESGAIHQIAGFMAYSTGKYGVEIGGGDVDGNGRDEILTGPGPSPAYGSHVRGWRYINGFIEDIPEINFMAYGTKGFGCKVSGGNTDLDSRDEIVTLPGPGPLFPAHLRGFNFDDGQVTPIGHLNFFAYDGATFKYGGNAAILELEDYR